MIECPARSRATGGMFLGQHLLRLCSTLALAAVSIPALAQGDPATELDQLSGQTATMAGGLALARSQSEQGDLLGALASIDRVLMVEPAARPALLLRAALLCRIDDREGGLAQLSRLKKRDHPKADWASAQAVCTSRPASNGEAAAAPSLPASPSQRNRRWPPPGY